MLSKAFSTTLNPCVSLRVFDSEHGVRRNFAALDTFVERIRQRLANEIANRLLPRYAEILRNALTFYQLIRYTHARNRGHSLLFDQQVFLHPMFRNLTYLESFLKVAYPSASSGELRTKTDSIRVRVRGLVKQLMLRVSHERSSEPEMVNSFGMTEPSLTQIALNQVSESMAELWQDYGGTHLDEEEKSSAPHRRGVDHHRSVEDEMDLYDEVVPPSSCVADPAQWWFDNQEKFPLMSTAYQIIYSVPSSSGPLELDIGHAGMVMTKQRTSLGGDIVEASLVVNRNRKLIDIVDVDCLSAEEMRTKLPQPLEADFSNQQTSFLDTMDVHFAGTSQEEVNDMMEDILSQDDED